MHVLLCIVTGRYSSRLYIAYAPLVSVYMFQLEDMNFASFPIIRMLRLLNFLLKSCSIQVVLGTLLASLVPVVGFNAVMTSEHFGSFLVCMSMSIQLISDA